MKPTEADIQAELIEGWEITGKSDVAKFEEGGWFDISSGSLKLGFLPNLMKFNIYFKTVNAKHEFDLMFKDFLTGNYDLSAISQHYEPEEWQRIITMCERIVRLITGEQVEQSLEEKVREIERKAKAILESFPEPCLTFGSADCDYIEFTSRYQRYWVRRNLVIKRSKNKSATEEVNQEFTLDEFMRTENPYRDVIKTLEAILTAQPESEQTLEEEIISVLEKHKKGYAKFWLTEHVLKINFNASTVVLGDGGWDRVKIGNNPEKTFSRAGLKRQIENKINGNALGWWGNHSPIIQELIELLEAPEFTPDHSKPSYSDLEQWVEELEKLVDEEHRKAKDFHRDSIAKSYRITDLEAQLQDYISPADHEREMEAWKTAFEAQRADLLKHIGLSKQYENWWKSEYAKNAEASQ